MSQHHLIVVQPFASYQKGHKVTAEDEVSLILKGPNHTHVVKIVNPDWKDAPAEPAGFFSHD